MKIKYENIDVKTLDENFDLSKFDCEKNDLNEFITRDAVKQQKEMLNVTHIFIYEKKILWIFNNIYGQH